MSIQKLPIRILASELANITKHNQYNDPQETLDKILSRNGLTDKFVPKTALLKGLHECSKENLSAIIKDLKLPEKSTIQEIEKTILNLETIKKGISEKNEEKSKDILLKSLDKISSMKVLKSSLENDIRMKRGNAREDNAMNKMEKKKNITISGRNDNLYSKPLFEDDRCIVTLVGKTDGVTEDKKMIVETKNRRNRLFGKIPAYEKVQLEAYMFLTDIKKCLHIENFNDEQREEEYKRNSKFWKECEDKVVSYYKKNIRKLI